MLDMGGSMLGYLNSHERTTVVVFGAANKAAAVYKVMVVP